MAYNRNLVSSTRNVRDSAKKQEYRRGKFENLPRIMPGQFTDGVFRIRLMPEDSKKNPHGYLDYRVHKVPQANLIEGQDPRWIKMQCPRSTNWDPQTYSIDPITGKEVPNPINVRCACCELDDYVFETPWDEDGHETIIDVLAVQAEGLKEIIAKIDFRSNNWDSGVYVPVVIQAKVHTHTKEEGADGNFYDRYTYCPGGSEDMLPALLKFKHPDFNERFDDQGNRVPDKNGLQEQFFRFLDQCPDANDLQFGRWVSITKINGGIGVGGYTFSSDPYPSPFNPALVEDVYKKLYAFPQWGDKTKKKPSTRLPYEQQVAILANAEWAQAMRSFDIPMTDADVDILDAGGSLVPNAHQPQAQYPVAQGYAPPTPPQHHYIPPVHPPQFVPGNPPAPDYAFPPATSAATTFPSNFPQFPQR